MNITRNHALTLTVAALTALTVLTVAGCGSSSTATASVNRSDPRAVSDAFAKAWGAGDYTTACSLTAGTAKADLMRKSQCTGQAGWTPQAPRAIRSCTEGGWPEVVYQVDQKVDQFLIFTTGTVKQTDGSWAVESLSENDITDPIYACKPVQPSGTG
jgi:hypothetical protein